MIAKAWFSFIANNDKVALSIMNIVVISEKRSTQNLR